MKTNIKIRKHASPRGVAMSWAVRHTGSTNRGDIRETRDNK